MFALVAKLRVDPDKVEAFETTFGEFATTFLDQEPGTLTYCLGRTSAEGDYRVIEIYESEAAFKRHVAGEGFQAFRPILIGFLSEPPSSERLSIVA